MVHSQVLPLEQAQKIPGLRAVFGEVYPDPVRVISVGQDAMVCNYFRLLRVPALCAAFLNECLSAVSLDFTVFTFLFSANIYQDGALSSVEFCGGTHISNTKEAQAFVLLGTFYFPSSFDVSCN